MFAIFLKGHFYFSGGEDFNPTTPDQILQAEDLPSHGIKTFGYSLGGGYDLDLNNHSDITVGAYASDTAFVIRSRPVIDIATYFKERRTHTISKHSTNSENVDGEKLLNDLILVLPLVI